MRAILVAVTTINDQYDINYSLDELSVSTGISLKNLNRYINDNEINISL